MKFLLLAVLSAYSTSCTHAYWEYQHQQEIIKLKHDQTSDLINQCSQVCGYGLVKECIASHGKIECYQEK